MTWDLEKIALEEEACAKILGNLSVPVDEFRTIGAQSSLFLPSTWLIEGSTLISPTGKRYLNYMENKVTVMNDIKRKHRTDYAKMVLEAHGNIKNGNGFRLATADEKLLEKGHRTGAQ